MAEFEAVAEGQCADVVRQFRLGGHAGALQQDGHDRDVALQCGAQFAAHEVVGVVEAAVSRGVLQVQPVLADQREHEVHRAQAFVQHLPEIAPQCDVVHIHEHRAATHLRAQVGEQRACLTRGFVAPVVDEDAGHDF